VVWGATVDPISLAAALACQKCIFATDPEDDSNLLGFAHLSAVLLGTYGKEKGPGGP
jgi:hypothetical protein